MNKKHRVVLADDHPIVLAGLRNLLEPEPDLEIAGEAASGLAALHLIRDRQPDVAVVDISMPELNGIQLGQRLAAEMPSVRLLVLTLHEDRAFLKQALDAGIRGYVLKRSAAENLVQAIRAVMTGGIYVDPALGRQVVDASPKRTGGQRGSAGALELSDREFAVLKLVALGFTHKEIAWQLEVGPKSIETYRARGIEKLGLRTRAELVRYASLQGWLRGA